MNRTVEEIITGCHVLGLDDTGDPVWGHVSARDPDGRGAWIKAGPCGFDEVSERDVVLTDLDGHALDDFGPPPWEYPLHTEVLRARPDVGSVVHIHPPHALAFAATGAPLRAFSNAAGPFAGGVPRYERPVGMIDTQELGREMAGSLGAARALFLVGHGIVTVGSKVASAVTTAVLLERACRLQLLAAAGGGIIPALENPGDRYAHTDAERYLERTWDYLVRRTRRAASA